MALSQKAVSIKLNGIPSSNGIAIGKVFILKKADLIISSRKIKQEEIEKETNKFYDAINKLTSDTNRLITAQKKSTQKGDGDAIKSILESELILIQDEYFQSFVCDSIKKCQTAEFAIVKYLDSQKHFFLKSKDEILRERAIDFDHIKTHLISIIQKQRIAYKLPKEECIVLSKSLTPNEVVQLSKSQVIGLMTEIGGLTSHSSILARSFDLPQVIGLKNAMQYIANDDILILDGFSGEVYVNPDKKILAKYRKTISEVKEHKKKLGELLTLPCETKDGTKIKLKANIDILEDINRAEINGAAGVGLVRSENIMMNKPSIPREDEQTGWYKEIADRAYPEEVTIRVFDFGSDKYSVGLPKNEANPALGMRGIRFLLKRKRIFKSQVKAILRASRHKNVKIMLPMIANFEELAKSKMLIDECKAELVAAGVSIDKNIKVGIMIETPASVIMAEEFARYCDFFSIGTNDLTQYSLAADRTNEFVVDIYDPFNPAILKMIDMTVRAAKKHNIEVGVCGELAGHSSAIGILLGLGITEFSVSPGAILEIKRIIREKNAKKCKTLASKVLKCKSSNEVHSLVK